MPSHEEKQEVKRVIRENPEWVNRHGIGLTQAGRVQLSIHMSKWREANCIIRENPEC
jgi:hypothetical protein